MGRQQVRCHGDSARFETVAAFIYERFGNGVHYIADVAGGQGMLSRILIKQYNYSAEVIDPRGFTLKGVPSVKAEYDPASAPYYDLIVGLHPDEALRPVIESAFSRPVLAVPCCNCWSRDEKLGSAALVDAICRYLTDGGIYHEIVRFGFRGPKNVGILTSPPGAAGRK